MPDRTMTQIMEALGDDLLDDIDAIAREAHVTYRAYDPAVLIEHDVRAQANCTYAHMVASACRASSPSAPLGASCRTRTSASSTDSVPGPRSLSPRIG